MFGEEILVQDKYNFAAVAARHSQIMKISAHHILTNLRQPLFYFNLRKHLDLVELHRSHIIASFFKLSSPALPLLKFDSNEGK